ncbi:Diphthine synthase [Leucogyrophana mollusca]|uniref:Diphthine synthase n=1 Tax=Leucogyrophana mollusca TaxID=85980 RepID=A0ACB8BI66_9AGAM|nr:Diphthine synthase [Leucogyrophana mollusca]
MLYVIGLGLCDEKDITVRGLEAVKSSSRVYLEAYTSILMVHKERLEAFYGKELIVADRDMVETQSDDILRDAHTENVALLVVGDPFGATTHIDILLRARALDIPTQVIHNASILNAVGACGLQLYNFGQTVSLVFFTDSWKPDSFYDRIKENAQLGLHTLVLLDIKVKEQSEENLARGRKIYEPPRYMSIPQAVSQLLEIEAIRQEGVLSPHSTLAIALSRVGGVDVPTSTSSPASTSTSISASPSSTSTSTSTSTSAPTTGQRITAGPLSALAAAPPAAFGAPLHSLVLVGKRLHDLEAEYARAYALDAEEWERVAREVYGVGG